MPRTAIQKTYINFSHGLFTEGNELSYPDNAVQDIDNMDFKLDGGVKRRAGLENESSLTEHISITSNITEKVFQSYEWKNVNGYPDKSITVVQDGDILHFYKISKDTAMSSKIAADTQLVKPIDAVSGINYNIKIDLLDFSVGDGKLYIAGKYIDPFILTYVENINALGSMSKVTLEPYIRDYEIWKSNENITFPINSAGISKYSLDGRKKQNFMSRYHMYNLANQGWPSGVDNFLDTNSDTNVRGKTIPCSKTSDPTTGTVLKNPPVYTNTKLGYFPTIADNYNQFQAGGGVSVTEQTAYSPWRLENNHEGNTVTGTGHFIQKAFNIKRNATGNVGTAETEDAAFNAFLNLFVNQQEEISVTKYRPSSISFYAGRIWYAGVESSSNSSRIYYSQEIKADLSNADYCYQDADPTAEVVNSLLPTDGGFIDIKDIGTVYKMEQVGTSLIILAKNGIWSISGTGRLSIFSATDFSIEKLSDKGAISKTNIVQNQNSIYYLGITSIYKVSIENSDLIIRDISSERIKTLYQSISLEDKKRIFSEVDEGANRILWFYGDSSSVSISNINTLFYNKVLYLDLNLGAFGKMTLGTITTGTNILPVSASKVLTTTTIINVNSIFVNGVQVTVNNNNLVNTKTTVVQNKSSLKILTLQGSGTSWDFRMSGFSDITYFKDWGIDTVSYVQPGVTLDEDAIGKAKKAPFLQAFFIRTETGFGIDPNDPKGIELVALNPSGSTLSYGWDVFTFPFPHSFEAYRILRRYTPSGTSDTFLYGGSIISTRNRIRGRGRALSLRFTSQGSKHMNLVGYAILFTKRGVL